VPVVGVDRKPVEMAYLALAPEALLQCLQLPADVVDLGVELPGQEVAPR
jgi:hypothetical protein